MIQATGFSGKANDNLGVASVAVTIRDLSGTTVYTGGYAQCSGCGTPAATWTFSQKIAVGIYRIYVQAFDVAGNQSNLVSSLVVWGSP